MEKMKFLKSMKPAVSKRTLLFIAAVAWTIAGGVLLFKGISILYTITRFTWLILVTSSIGGTLFYIILFSKISLKHTRRIMAMKIEKPCLFAFFSFKSYFLMTIMITSGILLRKSGILSPPYMAVIYITMGIPLFLSAFRFYYYGIYYMKFLNDEK